MAKKFVNLNNVWPIWDKIDELYVRKTDDIGNIKDELTLDLSNEPDVDINISNHNYINITEQMYNTVEKFINDYATRKYIKDDHNVYSVMGEFKNDNSLTEYEDIPILKQTNKLLIPFNDGSMYFLWAINLDTTELGGELGTYKIIQDFFIESITNEQIDELE